MSKYHEDVKHTATLYNMDIDRIKAAVEQHMQDNGNYLTWEACNVIQARIDYHGYPEPYVVPEQEKCINCFQPKDNHLPQCGLGSNAVPDVPGWMGEEKAQRRKQVKTKVQEKTEERAWPCRCGAGAPEVTYPEPGKVWAQLKCTCGARCYYKNFADATKQWNKHNGVQPEGSWYNLPPCTCGSELIGTNSITGTICCNDCERYLMRVCASTCLDQIAKAWAEGKGKRGEVYRVEIDHEPAHKEGRLISAASIGVEIDHEQPHPTAYFDSDHRGTVDPASPVCGCGNEAMWDLLGGREDYKLICTNYISCHRQTASYQSPEAAREEWRSLNQFDQSANLANGAKGKNDQLPTWENPGPCRCGWDKHFRGAGDRGAHIGCRRHGCNRTVMRSDKVTTLAAWIGGDE